MLKRRPASNWTYAAAAVNGISKLENTEKCTHTKTSKFLKIWPFSLQSQRFSWCGCPNICVPWIDAYFASTSHILISIYLYPDFEVYFLMSIPMEFRWCAISMGCMFAQFLDCVCFGSNKLKCLLPFLQIFHFLRNSIPQKTSPTIFDFRFYHFIKNV